MIHFTNDGVYADTEEEKLEFYDQLHRGDPVVAGHVWLWQHQQDLLKTTGEEIEE